MFREHRGNSNVLPEGNQDGSGTADMTEKKSRKPVFRTLEPRMVFDAAAAVAAEQAAQAPAHHEPVADTGEHTELAAPAWNHLEAALKAAPVTPVDKPTPTGGPTPRPCTRE